MILINYLQEFLLETLVRKRVYGPEAQCACVMNKYIATVKPRGMQHEIDGFEPRMEHDVRLHRGLKTGLKVLLKNPVSTSSLTTDK